MSIVTSVAVWFAMNPDEELTLFDIGVKWNMRPDNARGSLKYAEIKGWVTCTKRPDKTSRSKWRYYYTAGPRLLKEIGRG